MRVNRYIGLSSASDEAVAFVSKARGGRAYLVHIAVDESVELVYEDGEVRESALKLGEVICNCIAGYWHDAPERLAEQFVNARRAFDNARQSSLRMEQE